MKSKSLSSKLSVVKPILIRFLKEREKIEEEAKREGVIPKQLCEMCESNRYLKTQIVPLSEDEQEDIHNFIEWIRENNVTSVGISRWSGRFRIETSQKLGKKKPESIEEGKYIYEYFRSEFEKRSFYSETMRKFQEIVACPHFDPNRDKAVHLVKKGKVRIIEIEPPHIESWDTLFLCCSDCRKEIEKRYCASGAQKNGFTYRVDCDLNGLLLERILKESGLLYQKGEMKEGFLLGSPSFFLEEQKILIIPSKYPKLDETTVSVLQPEMIICFGEKEMVVNYLEFNTDVLVASEDGFYLYDHSKPIEESIDIIVTEIVEKIDAYVDEIRGNEHDRLVKAFEKIGQELGYIPEREFSKRGLRVDCVWYDRQGNIRVAIEVETGGMWKKDILSTWELEPELSVIVSHHKTDSVPKALVDFALMKSIPHKLFYINMGTKNAYLFDKQEILKKYSLEGEAREKHFRVKEI